MGKRTRGTNGARGGAQPQPTASQPDLARFFDLSAELLAVGSAAEGRWSRVNPALCAALGASEAELVAQPFIDLVHPDDVSASQDALAALAAGQATVDLEHRIRHRDGTTRWIAWRVTSGPQDGSSYFVGRDVTDRSDVHAELRRLGALVEDSRDFIGVADVEGRPVYVNPAGRRLVGLEGAPEATVTPNYYAPEVREFAARVIYPALEREGHWEGETLFNHFVTGERIPVFHSFFAIREPNTHRMLGYGTVTRDLRAQKRHEAEREALLAREQAARERAERLAAEARERSEFEQQLIGIVSHDLRNPLSAILLQTSSLLRRGPLDERVVGALRRVLSSAERASRLVGDLLDWTRARLGGGLPVEPRRVDLHALTHQVVEEVRANFPERDIVVSSEGDTQGCWDADRLAQVVTNLVANALKYSAPATPVAVWARGEGVDVVLEVRNEGAPIAEDARERLFQPMQRAAGSAGAGDRSVGLGLFIVKHIVEAHGGSVTVRSAVEAGTVFTVRLPRSSDASESG